MKGPSTGGSSSETAQREGQLTCCPSWISLGVAGVTEHSVNVGIAVGLGDLLGKAQRSLAGSASAGTAGCPRLCRQHRPAFTEHVVRHVSPRLRLTPTRGGGRQDDPRPQVRGLGLGG